MIAAWRDKDYSEADTRTERYLQSSGDMRVTVLVPVARTLVLWAYIEFAAVSHNALVLALSL